MYYNMTRTLEIFPYLSLGILSVNLFFLEIRAYREKLTDGPDPEPGRGGFIQPPGDGYEYYVAFNRIVYILKKTRRIYRVYVIQGEMPNTKIRQDRYGAYFSIRADSTASVERVVDSVFETGDQSSVG